ncbi:MAG: serine hydrolase domain-containing protein [Verrucomicrobiota bacterium]|jgi:CubicO group peptidase (beta-lactamase class C family)
MQTQIKTLGTRSRMLDGCAALLAAFLFSSGAPAADKFAAVPQKLQSFVTNGEIAGAVSLVATRDAVLHLAAVGRSDLASGRKLKTDDIFWIASMSKPVTAVAVAMLADEGKLSFDDPVGKYLPEFGDMWVAGEQTEQQRLLVKAARPVTLRDLLTHTSGLGEYRVTDPHWTLAAMSKVLAREPLRFQPGTRWSYSTAGMDVAGRVVEVASGTPYAQFLQRRLFDPLGMKDTTFWISPSQKKRFVQCYIRDAQSGKLGPATNTYMYGGAVTDHERPPLGGAGLFSTAEDVAKFYQMMLNHGTANGRRILKPETVAEMTRKQTGDLRARPGMPWGLGFCVVEDPAQMEANATLSPGTFGHGGAFGTQSWADPARGIIYVLMIERDKLQPTPDDSAMRRAYQQAVAAALDGK